MVGVSAGVARGSVVGVSVGVAGGASELGLPGRAHAGGWMIGAVAGVAGESMVGAVAGLIAEGTTPIEGAEAIATSFPSFESELRRLARA